jgi:hypothetical protein
MSFFITSVGVGKGGDLGGLEGADRQCQSLAQAAGVGGKTWHAYLSTQGQAGVNAKDRIGNGPWYNAKGVQIASNIADLHNNNKINKETGLDERGMAVKGRVDTPNQHDMLTGTQQDGTAVPGSDDATCSNWTSSTDGPQRGRRLPRPDRQHTRPQLLELFTQNARLFSSELAASWGRWPILLLCSELS